MARAAVKTGVLAGVYIGANKVLGANEYTISGLSAGVIAADEFGYAANKSVPDGTFDPGTISMPNVLKDPEDSTGQGLLDAACANGTEYGPDAIKFMRDATSYYTPGTGGTVIVTKAAGGGLKRNGLEVLSYEFKISGAALVIRPSLVSIAVTGGAMSIAHATNEVQQLIATGTYSSGGPTVITGLVVWASSDVTKAAVTASGLAVAIAAGTPNVTATLLGIVGTAVLTVT